MCDLLSFRQWVGKWGQCWRATILRNHDGWLFGDMPICLAAQHPKAPTIGVGIPYDAMIQRDSVDNDPPKNRLVSLGLPATHLNHWTRFQQSQANYNSKNPLRKTPLAFVVVTVDKFGQHLPIHFWHSSRVWCILWSISTPPRTNMDTQKDGLEKVTPFKHSHSWYLC